MTRETRSPDEIERSLSETRHHLESTLDALQARISPGSVFEDILGYARRDGGAFGRNLIETVRDNPVPATLLTVGLGWMMVSGRDGGHRQYGALVPAGERQDLAAEHHSSGRDRLREMGDAVRAGEEATVHGTAQAARTARDRAQRGWQATQDGTGAAIRRTREAVGDAVDGVGVRTRAAGRSMADFFEENPLAVGAMAVAAGAALAAFLPRTRTEDKALGPLRQRAVDEGRAQAENLAEQAAERTRAATHAAGHPSAAAAASTEKKSSPRDRAVPDPRQPPSAPEHSPIGSGQAQPPRL